ncbi:hypothetical protein, partial [Thermoactinomyces sp. CICC 10521]|uniref:hypothetical protein n=1 Tax=Thermoactinomyces sp. CICC 10521 TaxID=2767426 RepID=UPI0018DC176E
KVAASVITVASITTGFLSLDPEAVVQAFNKITVAAEKFEVKTAFKNAEKCFGYQPTPKYFASVNEPFFKCLYAPDGQGGGTSNIDGLTRLDGRAVRYKTDGGAIIQGKKVVKVNNVPKYQKAKGDIDLQYVAQVRKQLGLPSLKEDDILIQKDVLKSGNTVAVLESDGVQIWGRSGWGVDVGGYSELRKEWAKGKIGKLGVPREKFAVNSQTYTHAEGDVFWHLYQYRKKHNILGGKATLVVDRPFCGPCGDGRGVQNLVEEVGLDELIVKTPDGDEIIRPREGLKRKSW